MKTSKILFLIFASSILFFLNQSSYAQAEVPISDGFDFPLGSPNGLGYGVNCCGGLGWLERYDYSGDGVAEFHPGEDWNDDNSGNDYGGDKNDANDPVYSISSGMIKFASWGGSSWGYVVLIEHKLDSGDYYWSQYGHLKKIAPSVFGNVGKIVERGQVIGSVGDYPAGSGKAFHLHFEIRKKYRSATSFVANWSKEKVLEYYVEPTAFIKAHRPKPPVMAPALSGEIKDGKVYLNWSQSSSDDFQRYEVYRSEIEGGTRDSLKRSLIATGEEKNVTEYFDTGQLVPEKSYYYAVSVFENDSRSAISNEISLTIPRQIINLTESETDQSFPRIQGKYVVWEDGEREQTSFPQKTTLYYYNTQTKELGSTKIGNLLERLEGPYAPSVYENYVCFSAKKSYYAKHDIYCHDMVSGTDLPISSDPNNSDTGAEISSAGYVIWTKQIGTAKKIYALNLNNAVGPYLAVEAAYNQFSPVLSGSRIVWKDTRVGNRTDLYTKDLAGGEEEVLATNITTATFDISGENIVWALKGELNLYNVNTKEKKIVALGDIRSVRVDGSNVLYFDFDDGECGHLYVLNLLTNKKIKIDMSLKFVPEIDIFEKIIVFTAPGPNGLVETFMDVYLTWL